MNQSNPRSRRSALLSVGPVTLYVVLIFIGGSIRGGGPPPNVSDKTMHAAAFGVMQLLFVPAVRHFRPEWPTARLASAALGATSAVGALLEFWQAFIPYRSSEFLDWVADTVGASLAALLVCAGSAIRGAFVAGRRT